MKRFIFVSIALFIAFSFTACSNDDENVVMNENDEMPAWLLPKAEALAESFKDIKGDPALFYSISRATGIHGETVYRIYRVWDSCQYCNLYDEKGNHVDYVDVFGKRDIVGSEGWVVIFPKAK